MTAATPFTEMAALIAHNDESRFAGAVVVVPPGGGKPMYYMGAEPDADPVRFWADLETRCKGRATEEIHAATDQARGQGGWR